MKLKAAIQMSLGMIVALVFAVILLTLAIIWIQGIMSGVTEITHKVTDVARDQLMSRLSAGGRVGIAAPTVTTWTRGETGSFALGIRNENLDQDKTYYINVYLEKFNPGTGMRDCVTTGSNCPNIGGWLTFSNSEFIPKGESKASDIIIKPTTDAQSGIYKFKAIVCKESICTDTTSPTLYGDESFSIEIEAI